MNDSLPPWRSPIARALHRNRSLPQARYFQLATVVGGASPLENQDLRPHNRTMVFRGWLEPGSQLQSVTDVRSSKAISLLAGALPWAEVCWYFPETREQFRLNGTLRLVTAACTVTSDCKARQQVWQQMSDAGRIQFDWGMPGADRSTDPKAFAPPPPDPQQPSTNFCLLLMETLQVVHLELRGDPQNCYLYELVNGEWQMRSINP